VLVLAPCSAGQDDSQRDMPNKRMQLGVRGALWSLGTMQQLQWSAVMPLQIQQVPDRRSTGMHGTCRRKLDRNCLAGWLCCCVCWQALTPCPTTRNNHTKEMKDRGSSCKVMTKEGLVLSA
jgi:hypothetical protein